MHHTIQKILIDGPDGKLEVVLGKPESVPRGIAIVTHPHPLYGGTMDNKVVYTLFTALLELEFITAKFNFRGVGQSEGTYDQGTGEIEDVVTVAQTFCHQFRNDSNPLPLLLAGFSFGGAIQLHAAKRLDPELLILVSPSVANLNAPIVPETTQFALIIQGDKDNIVLPDTLLAWATPQSQPIVFIPGAEHFFHGKLTVLKQAILKFFACKFDESSCSTR